jgi:hypothetical protein
VPYLEQCRHQLTSLADQLQTWLASSDPPP